MNWQTLFIVFRLSFPPASAGKLPIPARLGARGTGMKLTNFPDRCTTNSTAHSSICFEVTSILQHWTVGRCSKWLICGTLPSLRSTLFSHSDQN